MLLRSSIVVTRQQIIGIKYSLALAFLCCTSAYTAKVEDPRLAETGLELDQTAAKLTRHHKSVAGVTRATNHGIGEFDEDSNADFRKLNPLNGGNVAKESVNRKLAGACPGSNPTACGCGEVSQTDYRGFIHTTENGHTCSSWTQGANYPDQGLDENYCRNPNEVGARAWCFVENPNILWDYCDVPTCSSTEQLSDPACVNTETYYSIDADIATIKSSIDDDVTRSHFLGGIVRLVAHDFMDYDFDEAPHLGQDGCLDWTSPSNTGLETIWCDDCALTKLYNAKYSRISRADFWVIAANSVIRQTSINQELDLKKTFYWGRQDLDSCPGSALRLPTTQGCQDVEGVFLERMGLTWQDAVALLGAHTLGRGNENFSGHHGTWVPNNKEAQIFDKKYYEELFRRAWFPRDEGTLHQDWTTGNPNSASPKMMLNTDMCLLYDIDSKFPCCSRTNLFDNQGNNRCITEELSNNECSSYDSSNERFPASQAVRKFLGGAGPNNNNAPFYDAFTIAWFKATTNGLDNLKPIRDKC